MLHHLFAPSSSDHINAVVIQLVPASRFKITYCFAFLDVVLVHVYYGLVSSCRMPFFIPCCAFPSFQCEE